MGAHKNRYIINYNNYNPSKTMLLSQSNCCWLNLLVLLLVWPCSQNEEDKIDITKISTFPQDYAHDIYAGYLNIT